LCKLPVKNGLGRQFAALPYKEQDGETVVMLVTSRDTHRWVLPKGWAETGLTGPQLAAKEAFEEAGLRGDIATTRVGTYSYVKRLPNGETARCRVDVFPLRVETVLEDWPERTQRQRRWFSLPRAAMEVREGDLVTLLLELALPGQ
jgi:8-oxo-dGTP pyrophosphatase MutT (NUDIX family)